MVDKKQIDISKKYQSRIRDEKRKFFEARTKKWCARCMKFHSLEHFYQPSVSGLTGISAWCKESTRAYMRENYARRRSERMARRLKNL